MDNRQGDKEASDASQQQHHSNKLMLFNSLTRRKESFLPIKAKIIKWYTCGPTVYDVAHLGHARCYITFDIIRRILEQYFQYQVFYVMNITDIDDKIIKRARCNHLFEQFLLKAKDGTWDVKTIIEFVKNAINQYQIRRSNSIITSPSDASGEDLAKAEMILNIINTSKAALSQLENLSANSSGTIDNIETILEILSNLRDVISDQQDTQLGHTIQDHEIFKTLTRHYEQQFHNDMLKLNVSPPSALTRVSEFIEEIGLYIKKLEANGYAYRSASGSVYFDTNKFDSNPKHHYAKLVREAFGQSKSIDEGEGELSNQTTQEKRSSNDFALWKQSKPGEPEWITQDYAPGRPGWHIECSVMASHMLGENFDIHSGGCDLKFPHHDNEIAQAEAYYDTGKNWINYFLHSGHLTISGCKMSKSLKNFITIRKALEDYTARQLRFAFLAHGWTETLDYSDNTMNIAKNYEKTFKEFFLNVTDRVRRATAGFDDKKESTAGDQLGGCSVTQLFGRWSLSDHSLNQAFQETVNKVDLALCDNFDTRTTLNCLTAIIKEYNKAKDCDLKLLLDIVSYVSGILHIFGTDFSESNTDHLYSLLKIVDNDNRPVSNESSHQEATFKYVDALAKFRADVRKFSKSSDPQESIKDILKLCDNVRDHVLPQLGVRLEDREVDGAPYALKLEDPATLARELLEKQQAKQLKEETARLEKLKLIEERENKMRIPPSKMFLDQLDKYSKFDEKGFPTHDSAGKEISKSAQKKLERLYAAQEARYNKYLEDQQK